mmetsp:Transcript_8863/g.15138  ORF Transcript_8863/g.15138 Transcript_8863/m.15138 type:complete len:98 (+) Transcript_8863:869-1162(+)
MNTLPQEQMSCTLTLKSEWREAPDDCLAFASVALRLELTGGAALQGGNGEGSEGSPVVPSSLSNMEVQGMNNSVGRLWTLYCPADDRDVGNSNTASP